MFEHRYPVGGISLREGGDGIVNLCVLARLNRIDLGELRIAESEGYIVADGSFEESWFR